MPNTPKLFLDFIQNSTFDYNSLKPYEFETLYYYLKDSPEFQKKFIEYEANQKGITFGPMINIV